MDEFLILVVDQDRKKVDGFYILNSPPPPFSKKNIIVETFSHKFYFHTANKIFPHPLEFKCEKGKKMLKNYSRPTPIHQCPFPALR